jgi:N-acetylmuramoyl-L-alanine amidase
MRGQISHIASFAVIGLSLYILSGDLPAHLSQMRGGNEAAVFMVDNITPQELLDKYEDEKEGKVRIFIMPGHEPAYGGAEYGSLKERDLNLVIAKHLRDYLKGDSRYEVALGRDDSGWNPTLEAYFKDERAQILAWKNDQARIMKQLVSEGEVDIVEGGVPHQKAPDDVALRLYGMNKWIGENDFDLAIHIHINDYGSRGRRPGIYSGYAIYVPEKQYSNSAAARMVAESISDRLERFIGQSDLEKESGGVVEDQELVAVGRYNTADAPALLIEYGYIYESQFQDKAVREKALREYAYQTYLGIRDFFVTSENGDKGRETATLPYEWTKDVMEGKGQSADAFALQVALAREGMYPPAGKSLNICPISGLFGPCTRAALTAFQKAKSIEGEEGYAGEATRQALD